LIEWQQRGSSADHASPDDISERIAA